MKKFPNKIYVSEAFEDQFTGIASNNTIDDLNECGDGEIIGVYRFEKKVKVVINHRIMLKDLTKKEKK